MHNNFRKVILKVLSKNVHKRLRLDCIKYEKIEHRLGSRMKIRALSRVEHA